VLTDLLGALGLLLVVEGIFPFLSPRRFRQALLQFAAVEDRPMRVVGLVCMLVGVLLLNAVK
jgi:uncharacterized protein